VGQPLQAPDSEVLAGGRKILPVSLGEDDEPARAINSQLRSPEEQKMQFIKAQELIESMQPQDPQDNQDDLLLRQNQLLTARLVEADDLIHELAKLVDISRNKQLQKKILKFADGALLLLQGD